MHGQILSLPGDLQDAVLTIQVSEVLKPLAILFKLGELGIIGQRCHNKFLLKII
jgi:hypothetical protein